MLVFQSCKAVGRTTSRKRQFKACSPAPSRHVVQRASDRLRVKRLSCYLRCNRTKLQYQEQRVDARKHEDSPAGWRVVNFDDSWRTPNFTPRSFRSRPSDPSNAGMRGMPTLAAADKPCHVATGIGNSGLQRRAKAVRPPADGG